MPYRQPIFLFFSLLLAAAQPSAWAQTIPQMLPYTGTIAVSGTPAFNGNGQFKFAIINGHADCQATPPTGCASFWSNNNTSVNGSEPSAGVTIPVTNGVFAVKLGDTSLTNMQAIPSAAFDTATTFLRVWFNDGTTGFQQLSPDRQLVSVPYAFRADVANSVAGSNVVGTNQLVTGGVTSEKLANAAVTSTQIATGAISGGPGGAIVDESITANDIAPNAITSSELASDAVTAGKIAPGSVGSTQINNSQVQPRVAGTCTAGSSIRQINADGTVACEIDDVGGVPSGAVMFFNLASCPSGWTALSAAQGRYLVGLNPGNGLGTVVGQALTNLENRPAGQHRHTTYMFGTPGDITQGQVVYGTGAGLGSSFIFGNTGPVQIPYTLAPTPLPQEVPGTNAPYIQLLVCQKD